MSMNIAEARQLAAKYRKYLQDNEGAPVEPEMLMSREDLWQFIESLEAVVRAKSGALPNSGCSHPGCQCTSCQLIFLRDQLREKEEHLDEEIALRERLSALLTKTAAALKGPPAETVMHSWSDLPDVAQALVAERDRWKRPGWAIEMNKQLEAVTRERDANRIVLATVAKALADSSVSGLAAVAKTLASMP